MADIRPNAPTAPAPRRKRRWLRTLIWICGIFVLLLVAVYFIGTSSAFLKGVILPRVSDSINANVTVSDASISPFKQVVLHNLKVHPKGAEQLLAATEVRARYHLMDIIRGNIRVEEVVIASPVITVVENPDGSSNLDPLLKDKDKKEPKKEPEKKEPSKPPQIDLKKMALTGATVRRTKLYEGGHRDVAELSNVNITLDDLKNGQTGKLLLSADLRMENNPPRPGTNGLLQAKVNGNFVFGLTADLKPASVTGNTRLAVTQAAGAFTELASLGTDLDCEITPTEIKQLALRFQKGDTRLGEVRVAGPFDIEKTEGKLKVVVHSIDKQVLNLAGAASGMDFGTTTLNSTNDIQLAKAGKSITASGQVTLAKLQVSLTNQTTPPLDLNAAYDVTVDTDAESALLRAFTLNGTQKGNPVLRGELTSPMTLAWGKAANAVGDSTLNIAVNRLDLADWKPFVGDIAPAGIANAKMKLLSQQGGKQLTFDLDSQLENLTVLVGTNQITQANVTLLARGKAADMKQFNLTEYRAQVVRQNQSLVELSGAGTYDLQANAADLQLNLRATLARLLETFPPSDIALSGGTAELKGHVKGKLSQKDGTQTVTGTLVVADLTGKVSANEFRGFGTTLDLHVVNTPREVQFPKLNGQLSEGGKPGGSFAISGSYDVSNKAAIVNAKLSDFNQNGLRPFLEPLLAEKKLVSVAINGSASAQYDPAADSAIKADLQVTNLVVSDPERKFPATPLEARMQVDTSLQKQVADVRQFQVTLTPTHRAKNQLEMKGKIDFSRTNAYEGNLALTSESLDVTSYYDLFAGQEKPAEAKPRPGQPQPAPRPAATPPPEQTEKPAETVQLPFKNFVADVNIGRLYLREVEITNLQAGAKINGSQVALSPMKLTLNGAPVDAAVSLDLGVPGYKYDTSFNLQKVPLAPLVNSFQPESKGQMGGHMTAQAKLAGVGTSGADLQKTLAGQFDIFTTNLNLSIEHVKKPWLKALINVVVAIPELARDPTAGLTSLAQNVTGLGRGGLSEEMKKSPIDVISARGVARSGRIELEQAVIQSVLFRAEARGQVILDQVLTNSPVNIPVSIALSYPVAQRISLIPSDTPTNAAYAKLPDFYTMKGTLGEPKNEYNKVALLGLAAKGASPLIGGKAGDLLQGVSGLLTGPKTAPATNAPGTNAAPAGTNQPAATTNQAPLNNLLDQLLRPKPKK